MYTLCVCSENFDLKVELYSIESNDFERMVYNRLLQRGPDMKKYKLDSIMYDKALE